jgi:hypothetical protein
MTDGFSKVVVPDMYALATSITTETYSENGEHQKENVRNHDATSGSVSENGMIPALLSLNCKWSPNRITSLPERTETNTLTVSSKDFVNQSLVSGRCEVAIQNTVNEFRTIASKRKTVVPNGIASHRTIKRYNLN